MNESTIAAHIGIQQLYSRYCFGLDGNDAELFLSCFAVDGVFAVDGREFVGHDALRPIAEAGGDRPRHVYLNPWVKAVNGDEAIGTAYFLTVDLATGQNSGYGHYDDQLQRDDDGEWRFVRRNVQFHWQSDAYKARTTAITQES
ncbi:nuclear transport factor 2 family protein [Ilumatobacter sp.]|uniref:nuclear transport factor 2 family protein n=1 Tax=Ilumatobacter sp. TaxID=1967498 RepID=UPI003752FCBE